MRRVLVLLLVMIMMVLIAAPALAATVAQGVTVKDGNTEIGVIDTAGASSAVKDFLRRFLSSDRNMIFMSADGSVIFFAILPDGITASFFNSWGWRCQFSQPIPDTVYSFSLGSDGLYHFLQVCNDAAFVQGIYCGGTYTGLTFPSPMSDYVLDVTGQLSIVDNGGLFGAGAEGDKPWYEQLFDWLGNFFQGLLDFFVSIFVPSDDYFDQWFSDVKSAADSKFGPVLDLGDSVSGVFDVDSSAAGIVLDIPADGLFDGAPSYHVDFLDNLRPVVSFVRVIATAIVCLFTVFVIYRRLVVLFEQ